jgi:predicted membrane metal-binding protein
MSYFVKWIGAVVPVALVVFLVAPWLSLIVLIAVLIFAVAALVALAASIVAAPYLLARYVHRLWLATSAKEQPKAPHVPLALHVERR